MATNKPLGGEFVAEGEGDSTLLPDLDADAAFKNRSSRKRTKTGCLTCRKRRIKCGEERPICKNCVKSKRHCEGYNQRVVWKPQVIDFRHLQNGAATITFPAATLGMDFDGHPSGLMYGISPSTGHPLGSVAYPTAHGMMARPYDHHAHMGSHMGQQSGSAVGGYLDSSSDAASGTGYQHSWARSQPSYDSRTHAPPIQPYQQAQYPQYAPAMPVQVPSSQPLFMPPYTEGGQAMPRSFAPTLPYISTDSNIPPTPALVSDRDWPSASTQSGPSPGFAGFPQLPSSGAMVERSVSLDGASVLPSTSHVSSLEHNNWSARSSIPHTLLHSHPHPVDGPSETTWTGVLTEDTATAHGLPIDAVDELINPDMMSTAHLLQDAAIEYHDDDYYDVTSDEIEHPADLPQATNPSEDFVFAHIRKIGQLQLEDVTSSTISGALDTYRPEMVANPLKNPATARVFAHFIQVTGRMITPLSGHARVGGQHNARSFSRPGLWTHTMPLAALTDQGLLQAMLALASLQIAGLTGESSTPSLKHYAFALKRVHQAVGHPIKRHSTPVVAASLLLGIYELWCAEHHKWNSHLAGAGQLLVEIDYVGKQKRIMDLKAEKLRERAKGYPAFRQAQESGEISPSMEKRLIQYKDLASIAEIDMQVLSSVAGHVVNYTSTGRVLADQSWGPDADMDAVDITGFEVQKDLFWTFCRQDAIGSIISGNPLLMPFARWTDCPPRGPVNPPDGDIMGAHDHLYLLLGRAADFNVRDRKRKLHAMESSRGKWVQPGAQPSRAEHGPTPANSNPTSPTMPTFFGMAPIGPNAAMPSSYNTGNKVPASESPEGDRFMDFAAATEEAIEEWTDIMVALDQIESLLQGMYQPITPPAHLQGHSSPFGPSIFYSSLDIACIWATIHAARIYLNRSHPHMPAHAKIATPYAAKQNVSSVELIGRICGGVVAIKNSGIEATTPEVAAALTDLNLPLFVAGIQLVHPGQRDWVVGVLMDIERSFAFRTSAVIARGCQVTWYNAGVAGRGPVYNYQPVA